MVKHAKKSSKFQAPSSREIPNLKHQTNRLSRSRWCLKLGASLELGCWCLELLLLAHDKLRELGVMMWRDACLELRQLAGVTPLNHLPDFVQPRDDGRLLMRHAPFEKFTHGAQLCAEFREQRRNPVAVRGGNRDGVRIFFREPAQGFLRAVELINFVEDHQRRLSRS